MNERITTEYKQQGEDLVVQTRMGCVGRLSLLYRTLWMLKSEQHQIVWARTEFEMGSVTLNLSWGLIPVEHIEAVHQFAGTLPDDVRIVYPEAEDIPTDFKSVFLARRAEGCEVFVDEASARFWAGSASEVMRLSLRAASSALKTDEATVVQSAVTATQAVRLEIQTCLSLLRSAESIGKRLREAGIS